jgi:Protein of unknown function DUF262/Protein of unknown function (DUF1524)
MRPSKLTIAEIFQQQRRHIVPLFQRRYVWTAERQWQPLLDDIIQLADGELERAAGNKHGNRRKMPNHFIGAVVLAPIDTYGRDVQARSVIDGQQRLTTLQIVLTALQDAAATQGVEGVERTFERLTRNDYRTDHAYEQFKVWPTTGDHQVFERVMTAGSRAAVEKLYPLVKGYRKRKYDPRPNLVEAYLFFERKFTAYLLDEDADGEAASPPVTEEQIAARLDALLDSITRRLEVVMVELEDDDDPQVIFESLNGRGEPLLPSDLIRNFVFLEANRQELDLERLHKLYWQSFDDNEKPDEFWQQKVRQGRLNRPRLDLFFFHFLTLNRQEQIPITQLYTEFRRWWLSAHRPDAEKELRQLQQSGNAYRDLFQGGKSSRLGLLVHRLQVFDTSVFYPVLLGLLTRWQTKTETGALNGICTDLESYVMRRAVCGLTPKNYNRIVLDLLSTLEEAPTINRAVVRSFFDALTGDSGRWPADAEFKQACQTVPLYERLKPARTQMFLLALDQQMESGREEAVRLGTLSVEHVYPQTPLEGKWEHITPEEGGAVLHQLGNLTLLTTELNSTIKNGPFRKKRAAIAKQSKLKMNGYFQDFEDDYLWGVDDIRKRGKELAQLALKVWPRP